MKTIKAIISALLFTFGIAAQAQQAIAVKTNRGDKEAFLLNKRIILDVSRGIVLRSDGASITYNRKDTIVIYPTSPDDAVAIKKVESNNMIDNTHDAIYDLSGRKVSRPAKGIYIQNGKKIAVK